MGNAPNFGFKVLAKDVGFNAPDGFGRDTATRTVFNEVCYGTKDGTELLYAPVCHGAGNFCHLVPYHVGTIFEVGKVQKAMA